MPTFTTMQDLEDKLPEVDDLDVLEKTKSDPLLKTALQLSRPVNWWGSGLGPQQILPIAEQGIPVSWIPDQEILVVLAAARPKDRPAILLSYEDAIVSQCRACLEEVKNTDFADTKQLISRSIDTLDAGFHEAAIALAVAVAEGLALWASRLRAGVIESLKGGDMMEISKRVNRRLASLGESYRLAREELASGTLVQGFDVPRRALIAPIPTFFEPFYPGKGDPVPVYLSRHAVAHQPTVEHFNRANAITAVMLASSLLRARDEHLDYVYIEDE